MDRVATFPAESPPRRYASEAVAWVFAPLVQHRRALLLMNLAYFGTLTVAARYAALNPSLQQSLLEAVGEAFSPTGALGPLVKSYTEGQLAAAVGLTFVVNLVLGTGVMLTLPSLVIPFGGIAVGLYRAFLWGILFSPTPTGSPGGDILIALPTILLEGEAYVIAILGVWLWWLPVVRGPRRWSAWQEGIRLQLRLYPAVIVTLLLAALYEATSVILLVS
jgi:hypothetical protein